MAILLHIDTSSPAGVAILAKDGSPVAVKLSAEERSHAGNINTLIADVLKEGGYHLRDVDAFVVCNGPGSYTGLRIALSTAKGFCYALNKPLILHNRLDLMIIEASLRSTERNVLVSVIPARAGEYYFALRSKELTINPTHISASSLQEILAGAGENLRIIGRSSEDLKVLISKYNHMFRDHHNLDIQTWATVGFEDFALQNFADLAYSEPQYLKHVFILPKRKSA